MSQTDQELSRTDRRYLDLAAEGFSPEEIAEKVPGDQSPASVALRIKQMLAARLIEEMDERPDPELDDERRRYYRITPFGQQVLQAETSRLAALVALAQQKGVISAGDVPGLAVGGAL